MLWGAFNNASSAMQAMSWDMGSISQNIANVNTTGYKRKETLFQTVMSETHAAPSGRLNAGSGLAVFGVQTADRYHIAAQGVITPSNQWSDLAINGSGFFMVAPPDTDGGLPATVSTDDPNAVFYTRDGAFQFKPGPNGENYFMTGAGQHLLGWMADDTGVVQATGMLEAVYTTPNTVMAGRATTAGEVIATLSSDVPQTPNSFATTATLNDPLGVPQDVTVTWQRVDGTTWTVTPAIPAALGAVTSGAISVTMDGWGNVTAPAVTAQTVTVDWADGTYGVTPDSAVVVDVAQDAPEIHTQKINMSVYDEEGNQHTAMLLFEKATFLTPPPAPAAGESPITSMWYLHPVSGDDATPGLASVATALTFNANGQIVGTDEVVADFSWTSGTPATTTTANVTVDLSQLSQYDGDLYIRAVDQDGFGEGTLMKSGFNEQGELTGFFTNGETMTLFKVPIAQFVSENRLDPISGNLFRRTQEAGDLRISSVEDAVGEPRFISSSLENSTVDIEDEFTKMIVTQKAYSTNATVFKTADEMTMTARDLKA